jgi:hypothetical protein
MDAYGGNDEESAELRKLLADVVRCVWTAQQRVKADEVSE